MVDVQQQPTMNAHRLPFEMPLIYKIAFETTQCVSGLLRTALRGKKQFNILAATEKYYIKTMQVAL